MNKFFISLCGLILIPATISSCSGNNTEKGNGDTTVETEAPANTGNDQTDSTPVIDSTATEQKPEANEGPKAICEFKANGDNFTIYSDGKVKCNSKGATCEKYADNIYKVRVEPYIYLIKGDDLYEVGAGSGGVISNFNYDPVADAITITQVDWYPSAVTKEDLESLGLNSKTVPVSKLHKLGKVSLIN